MGLGAERQFARLVNLVSLSEVACVSRSLSRSRQPFARVCSIIAVLTIVSGACHDDQASAPVQHRVPSTVLVAAGDSQHAVAGDPLPDSVAVVALDHHGAPIGGLNVDWFAEDSGTVDPVRSVTGANGVAATHWTLGPAPGDHSVVATVEGYAPLEVHANAAPATLVLNTIHPLHLSTYDGSGQTVHPDFVDLTGAADAGPLKAEFLAITPYPEGNPQFENPSVYTSLDHVYWNEPSGAINPVALPDQGYLSDPDIVYNSAAKELWLYYRQADVLNQIFLKRSADGVQWSPAERVTWGLNHYIVSPSVVRRSEHDWLMWAVNGQSGCDAPETWVELRHSTDGRTWTDPERVSLVQPGFTPWHIDVQWIPSAEEFWALYNVKTPQTSCATPALYLATSRDGITWTTYPSPVLMSGDVPQFRDIVYRSTFRYKPETDVVTFWYSGAAYDGFRYVWSSAVQRRPRAELFSAIARQPTSANLAQVRRSRPPLVNPP
jgi:hypothetical protein